MNAFRNWVLPGLLMCLGAPTVQGENPEKPTASKPALPEFIVVGHEREMRLLGDLYELHHSPRITCSLWDAWLPMSTLWPAIGEEQTAAPLRDFYRRSFLGRHHTGWPLVAPSRLGSPPRVHGGCLPPTGAQHT